MSFFRPDSPPPRLPSPDVLPAPLPHPRRQPSQPRIHLHSPGRTLHPMRSMDLTTVVTRDLRETLQSVPWTRQRTQSTHTSRSTPRSSPALSHSPPPNIPRPKRTMSVSIPSPAPSPTPTMVSPFPPSWKSSVACAPNGIACPRPVSLKPIMFEQTEALGVTDRRFLQKPSKSSLKSLSSSKEKHKKSIARFFGIKTPSKQLPTNVAGL